MKLNKYLVIIVIIVILVIFLHTLKWPFFIGKIFLPFQYFFSYLDKKISKPIDLIFTKKNLLEENQRLKDELTKLIVENIKLKIIKEENERLRKESEFIKKENYKSILTNIIGKKEEAGITWFIINRGKGDGIKEGFIAVKEGVVVGKIIKTMENFSYLLPLLDDQVRLAVMIVSPGEKINIKDKIEGLAKGKNGLIVELDLVPLDKEIKNNDLVLTSGLEYKVPKGLLVGILKDVKSQPAGLFHKAIIEIPIKLENIEIVSIIIPKIEPE